MSLRTVYYPVAILLIVILCLPVTGTCESERPKYQRTVHEYAIPDVTLLNQDGKKVQLKSFLRPTDKVIILDFIFGTCTTICPVLSASFAEFSEQTRNGTGQSSVGLYID